MVKENTVKSPVRPRATLDFLFLAGSALFVAALLTASFWMADKYNINQAWLFAAQAAVFFFAAVGWGYRKKFRSPAFVRFFLAWLLLHVTLYLLVLGYLGLLYYVPFVVVEVWIGYALAIWLFGPPQARGD
jgi:phosphotransferase system  glucose/maltose/N-acetylglucosamine-specific IIC component